ncbi:5975_t:CDS:2 [Funneliformis caledonium]|uniref:5975_t:CDS:1 n=1 Tax=Funneliformis caledonium TaxID=1117310 RepID=A0A9N9IK17_9GLOM|nr:5975_t:CDS:2 [Funneliformis caledonium]
MPNQLLADCLNEVSEHLEDDKTSLHSCLLVNRLWCMVSARILWKTFWNFNMENFLGHGQQNFYNKYIVLTREIFKMLMSQSYLEGARGYIQVHSNHSLCWSDRFFKNLS